MLIRPSQVWRLMVINRVLARHSLDEIVLATHLFRPVRFMGYLSPWRWFNRNRPRGERIRKALEDLGPIFVKFGQILSTRGDLLPPDIALELAKLQDQVPSFDSGQARRIIEKALGESVTEAFAEFETEPLASASIAQVHGAKLHSGESVVVKVVRPGIDKIIDRDLSILYAIAELAQRYWTEGRRLHPREVVGEFDRTLHDELDLQREAANTSQLRRNFADSDALYVPDVHWDLCRKNVMVMERIEGIPIGDTAALQAKGVNFQRLAELGVEIFFTQVFRDSFFHADMHPGNIFVDVTDPQNPKYIAVDFGIMGTLSPVDQQYLAENFLAFFNRDYRRVAELHVESGWVPSGTRVDEFEAAIRTVSEPIFGKPLAQISFGHFLLRLFQTARRFNMEVQPQLVLLQKTLLSIEGLGRRLYPDLDLWQTAKPFLERWMNEQVGPRAALKGIKQHAPHWGRLLPELPELVHRFLDQATEGNLEITQHSPELRLIRNDMQGYFRQLMLGLTGLGLMGAAILIWGLSDGPSGPLGVPLLSWGLGGLSALAGFLAWPRACSD